MPLFSRYIGIDYSGAEVPTASLKGLRVFVASGAATPAEVLPPPSPRKHWTRRGIAEWLAEALSEDTPTVVGIDHGFSFPLAYFQRHRLAHDWPAFLADFRRHWPTDDDHMYVDFAREGVHGHGAARMGDRRWRRLTEIATGRAKPVFHFDVQGSVAKSTHAGLPWLLFLREQLGSRVHFWPFDGFDIPPGGSVIAEVYPALWKRDFPQGGRDDHQQDAYAIAATLARFHRAGTLDALFHPEFDESTRATVLIEGWILGVEAKLREQKPRVSRRATARLDKAFEYARKAHGAQKRKGTNIPYISHLMSVSALVMEYGGDEDQAIAGLLHDCLEDCGAWHETVIRAEFGARVADIVVACTDGVPDASGKKPPWRERKERYLAHLKTVDEDILLVSACDKLHNARAIAADLAAGADVFARFKAGRDETLWYYDALVRVFRARMGDAHPLVRQLAGAVQAMSDASA